MSLSFWVRDYLFLPMRAQWRRSGHKGMIAATLLSFTILGTWHGAGWQFAIYGVAWGVLAVGSLYTLRYRDAVYAALRVPPLLERIIRSTIVVILVALVLVLFRANYLSDAFLFYRDIFSLDFIDNVWVNLKFALFHQGDPLPLPMVSGYWWGWLLIAVLVAGDIVVRNGVTLAKCPLPLQVVAYNAGLILIVYQWVAGSVAPPFLYYKF
jgi:hypothetical protein